MSDGFDELGEAESSFGPGFDLIVGLLAVVLVSLQLARVSLATAMGGDTDLTYVAQSKDTLLRHLCSDGGGAKCTFATGGSAPTAPVTPTLAAPPGMVRIEVEDLGTNQTLRIGDELLFAPRQATLTGEGRVALQRVIGVIWSCRDLLREVQVQGHADRQPLWRRGGNLQLAADRAIEVYREFEREGVDPQVLLLSAATYDSFKPIDREPGRPYDWDAWNRQSEESLHRNRRVEFHLIYRLTPQAGANKACQRAMRASHPAASSGHTGL